MMGSVVPEMSEQCTSIGVEMPTKANAYEMLAGA
jgi:hypothetical protein